MKRPLDPHAFYAWLNNRASFLLQWTVQQQIQLREDSFFLLSLSLLRDQVTHGKEQKK